MKPKLKKALRKEVTRKEFLRISFLIVVSSFAIYGILDKLLSQAATPYAAENANKGTLSGGAKSVANAFASDGNEVEFSTTTVTPGMGKIHIGAFVQAGITGVETLLTAGGLNPSQSGCQQFSYASGGLFASNNSIIANIGTFPGPYKVFAEAMYWNGSGYDPDALLPFSNPGDTNYATAQAYYLSSAKACIAANITNIRLGWEFNGGFAGAAQAIPTVVNFLRTWKLIYTIYNNAAIAAGKPSGYFSFMFCPDTTGGNESFGSAPNGYTISDYYPGKAYMGNPGWICTDYYPSSSVSTWDAWLNFGTPQNGGWGFQTMLDLAVANGNGLALGEWGSQGIDDPGAMTDMLSWTVNTALPALKGGDCLYLMWGDHWNGTSGAVSGSWDLEAQPNQWAAIKSAFATYKSQGLIG